MGKKQLNIKIDEERKDEWREHADESPEVTSMSHLIRLAVEREIADEHSVESTGDHDIELDPLVQRLEEMDETISTVSAQVSALETGQIADSEEIDEVADRLYDIIPRREIDERESAVSAARDFVEDADYFFSKKDAGFDELAEEEPEMGYGIVEAYRRMFDIDEYEMEQAIDRLDDYSSRVEHVTATEYDVLFEVA